MVRINKEKALKTQRQHDKSAKRTMNKEMMVLMVTLLVVIVRVMYFLLVHFLQPVQFVGNIATDVAYPLLYLAVHWSSVDRNSHVVSNTV